MVGIDGSQSEPARQLHPLPPFKKMNWAQKKLSEKIIHLFKTYQDWEKKLFLSHSSSRICPASPRFRIDLFYTYFLKGEAKLQGSKCLRISSKSHFLEFTGHENINFGFKSLHWNTKNFSFYSGGRQVLIKFNFKTKLYCCGENLRVQHLSQSGISEFRSFAKMIILSKWGACQSC